MIGRIVSLSALYFNNFFCPTKLSMLQKFLRNWFTTSEFLSPGCGRAYSVAQSRYYANKIFGVTPCGHYASVAVMHQRANKTLSKLSILKKQLSKWLRHRSYCRLAVAVHILWLNQGTTQIKFSGSLHAAVTLLSAKANCKTRNVFSNYSSY
jgi:hypothetical protein